MSSQTENALFIRECQLIVGIKVSRTDFSQLESNGLVLGAIPITGPASIGSGSVSTASGVRVTFEIEKTTESKSNKSKISVYNLSQETRNFLENDNVGVILKAGFRGENNDAFPVLGTIFSGDLNKDGLKTERKGPDIITTLECGDAEEALTNSHLDLSLGPGATLAQIINAATAALGLSPTVEQGINPKTFLNGFQFSGKAKDLLDQVLKSIGAEWNVQDNELRILSEQSVTEEFLVSVTPQTGLLGFPTKTKEGVRFRSLINPLIRPGRRVKLESKQLQGVFGVGSTVPGSDAVFDSGMIVKCRKVKFKGDNREGVWEGEIEGSAEEGLNAA